MIRAIVLLIILNLPFGCIASGKVGDKFVGSVPKEIYQLMKKKKCSPIEGFYDRVISLPPFVYISNLVNGGTAIFFVCEMDNPVTENRYKIVVINKIFAKDGVNYVDFIDCPSEIIFRSMPGGLAVRPVDESSLLHYNLWEDTKNYKRSDRESPLVHIDKNPLWMLDERHEGVGYGFFCTNGNWYNISYD